MENRFFIAAANTLWIALLAGCPRECDHDWSGTEYECNCPSYWNGDGFCDCGCQFDDADCGANGSAANCAGFDSAEQFDDPNAGCDYVWYGTQYENNCPSCWNGDGTCDCGCQFEDVDCGGAASDAQCDYVWYGTQYENNCPSCWNGDGTCDCGCQFEDIDCR